MSPESNLTVPCLPESAPFSPEQRAYLNGFLAGLFSRAAAPRDPGQSSGGAQTPALLPLSILFGSQTGTAEGLAKRAAREAGQRGFAPTVLDLASYTPAQLCSEQRLLFICSTFGDGEPPDNARTFWKSLTATTAPNLGQTRYAVCALGDSNYPKFCAFGRELDLRLEGLGAQRVRPCAQCDVDYEETFVAWLNQALAQLGAPALASRPISLERELRQSPSTMASNSDAPPKFSRSNPYLATLAANLRLNAPDSAKDTRHFQVDLNGSGLTYQAGDVLGVFPSNCPELVEDILGALRCTGNEPVPGLGDADVPVRQALLNLCEITKIPQALLAAIAERSGDEQLKTLGAPHANGGLATFLTGREIIDLLRAYPAATFRPAEFVGLLKRLAPRLYSISSSSKVHPGEIHLTVSVVRYQSLGRPRKGVCSTFLAERVRAGGSVPIFVHPNPNFRAPAGGDTPMIMIGPGTGIAPFRAFLQERRATGARGKNWLFFGDQRAASDFLYRDELHALLQQGLLTRLDKAFSRDQSEKVYVQNRMLEQAESLFAWLNDGAHLYVCGDASRMAKDVDTALHQVVQRAGQLTQDQAVTYIDKLKAEKRYLRDVY